MSIYRTARRVLPFLLATSVAPLMMGAAVSPAPDQPVGTTAADEADPQVAPVLADEPSLDGASSLDGFTASPLTKKGKGKGKGKKGKGKGKGKGGSMATVNCKIPAHEAWMIASSKGWGFECFLYDHTKNVHNIVATSKRHNLKGPFPKGNGVGCWGKAPAGFQTVYGLFFQNRKLNKGWRVSDMTVKGNWDKCTGKQCGGSRDGLVKLKSRKQYKKRQKFNLLLSTITLTGKMPKGFKCNNPANRQKVMRKAF